MPNNHITESIVTYMSLKGCIDLVGSNGITRKRLPKIKSADHSQLPSGFWFLRRRLLIS